MASLSSLGSNTTVKVHVTHSHLQLQMPETRLDLNMTIRGVKDKLCMRTGTAAAYMTLLLKDGSGAVITMSEDDKMLGYYGVRDNMTITVVDNDPHSLARGGGLEDLSQVEKYEISDSAYDTRDDTFRKFKAKLQVANPSMFPVRPETDPEYQLEAATQIAIGNRCEVQPGGRRGEVKFVGKIESMGPGYWVGVQLDEPTGKSDGSFKGERIFECAPKYGAFVRPEKVVVGDFPADDLDLDLHDDEL
eukprot:GILK01002310.1.p1 GENE.GILK01002310.1~~GILK01002310.1.p1  ORF type:complete len:247 (+),score=23.14 GILK01002310.1:54-794(+)